MNTRVARVRAVFPFWGGLPAWAKVSVPFLFFWVMELPHRLGLISAWVIGLLLDVLYADPLGLNGFLLAAITYVGWRFYERLRMYSIVQQCVVVFLLVLATESLRVIVQDVAWSRGWSWGVFLPALMSMLAWPFVYLLLQRARLQVRVE